MGVLEAANTSSGEKSATSPVATYSRNHGDDDSRAEAAVIDKHKEQCKSPCRCWVQEEEEEEKKSGTVHYS